MRDLAHYYINICMSLRRHFQADFGPLYFPIVFCMPKIHMAVKDDRCGTWQSMACAANHSKALTKGPHVACQTPFFPNICDSSSTRRGSTRLVNEMKTTRVGVGAECVLCLCPFYLLPELK